MQSRRPGRRPVGRKSCAGQDCRQGAHHGFAWPYDDDRPGGRFGNYTADGDTYETGGPHSTRRDYHHSFADEIFESIHDGAGAAISIRFPRSQGGFTLTFPLAGLKDALEHADFDTRPFTQYESTWHFDGGAVSKSVFWLHQSDYAEFVRLRESTLKFKATYAVREHASGPND
ncbi:MAG: hypothetical protein OXH52_06950 [Gammaproteobacteria bacterium]|nr:hypothetical protein [Gammaproteobacteria bacterium]